MTTQSTVMVTGASGFIASHLIPVLNSEGYHVVGVDRLPLSRIQESKLFTFQQDDIANISDLNGIDYVIHLACETNIPATINDPVGTTYNNVDLGIRLLELAKQAGVKKFLFPSTASLYGNQPTPWNESLQAYPTEPYSLQKYSFECFCRYYAENGLPTVIFRLFQVFGEKQRADQVLSKFYECRQTGKPIPIMQSPDQTGSQSAKRDWVYAGDIAKVFCMALASNEVGKGEIINIASGKTHTIGEIAELISDKVEYIPKRSFDLDEHLADVKKAKELLHWEATTDIKDWLIKYVKSIPTPSSLTQAL